MSAAIRLIVIAAFCSSQFSCDAFSPDRTQGLVRAIFKNAKKAETTCSDSQTRCNSGCCDHPNAVCCADGLTCCPSSTICNLIDGTCEKEASIVYAHSYMNEDVTNVVCPGGRSQCPDDSTCCPLSSGQYGCCPVPNAVCCSDKIHCCPGGYTCDTSQGTCIKGNSQISWLEKSVATDIANVVCPGGQSQCPDGTTCCPLSSGGYGCCPLPNAVCCSDKIHCCPSGYTCDTSQGTCIKGNSQISWLEKSVATVLGNDLTNPSTDSSNVANRCVFCPDDTECPEFNTCCQLPNLKYGCCGFPHAVCCSDHTHCCRHGEICDVEHGLCRNAVEHSQHPMLQMAVFEERSFASKSDKMSFDEM